MKRYAIWDKQSQVITPIGEVLSPQEWLDRYPYLSLETMVPVVAYGTINGAFCGELSQMKFMWEQQGAEFDDGLSNEEILEAIEAFEDAMNEPDPYHVSTEERIAAALEAQVMMSLPDDMWDEELTEEE